LSQYGHFSDKGEGVNYSGFCADDFYGRPLTSTLTLPNPNSNCNPKAQ